jgi:hypothetical protein
MQFGGSGKCGGGGTVCASGGMLEAMREMDNDAIHSAHIFGGIGPNIDMVDIVVLFSLNFGLESKARGVTSRASRYSSASQTSCTTYVEHSIVVASV